MPTCVGKIRFQTREFTLCAHHVVRGASITVITTTQVVLDARVCVAVVNAIAGIGKVCQWAAHWHTTLRFSKARWVCVC